MTPPKPTYPLLFVPLYKEKVWGGRALEKLGRRLPGGDATLIGESWEVADLAATATSGGGGGAARSVVRNGPLKGKTLHDLIQADAKAVVGDLPLTDTGDFPLLVKFLDARQNLSVQVHPSPQYAAAHLEAHLKSEAWVVIHAEAGAVIYKGIHEGATPEQFRQAIENNTVEPLLIKVPAKVGDAHYLPSGTCHALGAGVLVAEGQTPSDTTFRVYDWGRKGRELHIEQAMACIHFGPAQAAEYEPNTRVVGDKTTVTRLIACEYFHIDRYVADESYTDTVGDGQVMIWMCLNGAGRMRSGGETVDIHAGETVLIPAAMSHGTVDVDKGTKWLVITLPRSQRKRIA